MNRKTKQLSGMFLYGIVKDRRKREIIKNEKSVEIVTYDIIDNDGRTYYVDAFSPEKYYDRGKYVQIPIYIKAYKKKNGDPSYTVNVRSDTQNMRGESF